jgi:hypothetical protein
VAEAARIQLELTESERSILRSGIVEWGGPARVTQELAVAMGFHDQADLFHEGDRLIAAIEAAEPMTPLDWARTLLATEIVFASNLVGSGRDWSITTGFSDAETLASLREIQRKVPRAVYAVFGRELGTRPPGKPLG